MSSLLHFVSVGSNGVRMEGNMKYCNERWG